MCRAFSKWHVSRSSARLVEVVGNLALLLGEVLLNSIVCGARKEVMLLVEGSLVPMEEISESSLFEVTSLRRRGLRKGRV